MASSQEFEEWLASQNAAVASNRNLPTDLAQLAEATGSPYGCIVMYAKLVKGKEDDSLRGFEAVPCGEPVLSRFMDQICLGLQFEFGHKMPKGQRVLVKAA
ncbi:hypothetical protein KW799_00915 [Candidatus Parcubacteria bacterium]|nr:hypothetical protein [Candidatus Parcubacteria bacterium]